MVDVIASGGAADIKMEDCGSSEKSIIIGSMAILGWDPLSHGTDEHLKK
jgi:hypothetical protein